MSDIVERLFHQASICRDSKAIGLITKRRSEVVMFEAAAEITRLRAELAEARDKALDEAANLIQSKHDHWRTLEAKYRSSGNNGPYLGGPSYYEAAQTIRALKSPKPQEAAMSEGVGG